MKKHEQISLPNIKQQMQQTEHPLLHYLSNIWVVGGGKWNFQYL